MRALILALVLSVMAFPALAVIPTCSPGYVAKCVSGCVCSGRGCGGTLHPVYVCQPKSCSSLGGLGYGTSSGGTASRYTSNSVPYGQTCDSATFTATCNLGVWTPTPPIPLYWTCTVAPNPNGDNGDPGSGNDN